ncbi:hypothetical protein DUI87_09055 [Hirundo rustica rustica]|uniref:RING-type domain-containing protein n=1 Tax=Hirundo rustica rustica TaxID=333673 RepID=A0A3M0KMX7_HIRRU|nr:hypothetical protein DUI87_09055 [Hirundo rustica rustica]
MGEQTGHPLPGHGMLAPVARGTAAPQVLLARTLLSQLTDSLLRSRRGASVFSIPGGNRERFADTCEPNSELTVQRKRKRPGGAVESKPARKRSRLLPSSAGEISQTEPRDLEQSGPPASEPEIIDLTGESSESEVIVVSDDESAVDREQSQQQPHLFRASENSAEPVARNDEEEPREDDGDWLLLDFDPPYWSDEDSEDRAQNQPQSHLSRSADNSLTPRDEEEPRDNDGTGKRASSIHFVPDQQRIHLNCWRATFNRNPETLNLSGQERRNVTLNNQEQVDVPDNGTGANDAAVADSAPSEPGSEGEDTQSSDAEPGVIIRCPVCMDFYSQIVQSGRQLVTTMCGHVFCSECLPVALETSPMCPNLQDGT